MRGEGVPWGVLTIRPPVFPRPPSSLLPSIRCLGRFSAVGVLTCKFFLSLRALGGRRGGGRAGRERREPDQLLSSRTSPLRLVPAVLGESCRFERLKSVWASFDTTRPCRPFRALHPATLLSTRSITLHRPALSRPPGWKLTVAHPISNHTNFLAGRDPTISGWVGAASAGVGVGLGKSLRFRHHVAPLP